MRSLAYCLIACAASCTSSNGNSVGIDAPPPQPIACGSGSGSATCTSVQYCDGLVCDDVAMSMGQCQTQGTTYSCVALPSECIDDATCGCLLADSNLKNQPGASCVEPRTYSHDVF